MRQFCTYFSLFLGLSLHTSAQVATPQPPKKAQAVVANLLLKQASVDCAHPFGLSAGQQLEYQVLDNKDTPTGLLRYSVVSIKTDTSTTGKKKKKRVATTTVKLKSGFYDLSNLVLHQQDLQYTCRRDSVYTDGLGEINYAGLKSFRNRLLAYTGTPLAWPNEPTPNTILPKGGAQVQVSSPSVDIAKVITTVKDRKILAGPTSVTVPAGTFSCYTVESKRELATAARVDLVLKNTGRQVDYYSPVFGIIKTEYYDKGNNLVESRVLAKK